MSQTYTMKRGATLSLAGSLSLPAPTGAWSATAQVRTMDGILVEDLTATVTSLGGGQYNIQAVGNSQKTSDWPINERLLCDIRFADEDTPPFVIPTPTFFLKVEAEVTRDDA
jgi:hypothetical protein